MTRSAQAKVLPPILVGLACVSCASSSQVHVRDYPETRAVQAVDDYHGTRVADPYRWLEDVNSPEVSAWVGRQNAFTFTYLEKLPHREQMARRMARFLAHPRTNRPVREGGRIFWTANTGVQDHSVLHVRGASDAGAQVLIDPNTLSDDGSLSMSMWVPSPDGTLLAWGLRDSGSDWQTFHVRDVATGRDLGDTLRWVKFSEITWTKDGAGFFYSRYDEPEGDALTAPNAEHQLFYHLVGTPQSEDRLIVRSDDHPDATLGTQITDDGRYVLVHQYRLRLNQTLVLDLGDPMQPATDASLLPLFSGFDASYSLIGSDGPRLYILTNDDAPMGRIVAVNVHRPERENWQTVIPEAGSVIAHADIIGSRFVVEYLEDAKSVVRFFSMAGDPMGTLDLPGPGTVSFGPPGSGGFSGNREDTDFFYTFQTFVDPGSVLRYDFETGRSTVHHAPELAFDAAPYITEQVFYTSRDGTRVPMFIVRRENLPLDGSHPVMLFGYGGFGISWPPAFAPFIPAWLEMGGVWAWANLRGGSEYGRAWHEAGTFGNKQNVFDDFIAAGEYLIAQGYTRPEKLGIFGASNGGLLVGAVMVQRPDLFRVALPDVGLYDMLRYHTFVAGRFGLSEYGSSETPEGFEYIRAYSPLHNVQTGTCYPAMLVTTADHEDRVPPLHSYKFAAALQTAQACDRPIMLRVDANAGHGAGMPRSQVIRKYADMWSFAAEQLGMSVGSDTVHVAPPTGAGGAAIVPPPSAPERSDTLALTNVTLIDGTGAPPRPHMTVLVYGDRIGGIFAADEAPIPASADVLDMSGRYLIPGLINTHIHLPMMGWTRDSVAAGLERMLRAGVTTVREMAGDARLAAELNRAALVEGASLPTIHFAVRMAGSTFYERAGANRSWIGYPAGTAPWAQAVMAETDMARAVAVAAGTGATGLKLYADLDADVVRRLVAEAHRQGLKAWAHGTVFPTGPLEAVRAGIDGLSHICFLFWGLQPVVAASMAERVPFDPDLIDLEGDPFQELLREMRVRDVVLDVTARNASRNPGAHAAGCTPELLNRSLRAAHRAGVRISTGTDYFIADGDPDPTLFTEIEFLVDTGVLSPLEAITAATENGARAIGIEERYGTIEAGKVADFVILSRDPTQHTGALQSVVAVFKDGRQVSRRLPESRENAP